jgi:GTP 3',8-cyclase
MGRSSREYDRTSVSAPGDAVGSAPQGVAPAGGLVLDAFQRPLKNLRISVTDRCNLRCQYCMPEEEYAWLPRVDVLTFDELDQLVGVFVDLGVDKIRLTGGEPLLRADLPSLVRKLASKPGVRELAMTTNGVLLAKHVRALKDAGLHRVTVSLDTLRPDRFARLSRRTSHAAVLEAIGAVATAGFTKTKIDTVVMRGVNDDELVDLIEFARAVPAEVRFIEYMDVGGATGWSPELVFSRAEMLQALQARYGRVEELNKEGSAPADQFALPDGTVFGIISSTTQPFCALCDRSRLTADGIWYRCLYALAGTNLRAPLRAGATPQELRTLVAGTWHTRRDQGAVDRHRQRQRTPLVTVTSLKRDPHLEMHTRGG